MSGHAVSIWQRAIKGLQDLCSGAVGLPPDSAEAEAAYNRAALFFEPVLGCVCGASLRWAAVQLCALIDRGQWCVCVCVCMLMWGGFLETAHCVLW